MPKYIKLDLTDYFRMKVSNKENFKKLLLIILLTGEEILPPDQRRVLGQSKFTYSPIGKAFEKQTKTIEEQGKNKPKL